MPPLRCEFFSVVLPNVIRLVNFCNSGLTDSVFSIFYEFDIIFVFEAVDLIFFFFFSMSDDELIGLLNFILSQANILTKHRKLYCLMDSSILIKWTSPFRNYWMSGLIFHFYFISNKNSCKQTV